MNIKLKMKKIYGRRIEHEYDQIEDWDGSFCSDFCIGCGDCDHFPTKYAISCYEQTTKKIEYYCDKCFVKKKSSIFPPCLKDEKTDITISLGDKNCSQCSKKLLKEMTHIVYRYSSNLMCGSCAKTNKVEKKTYYRVRTANSFQCDGCKTKYRVVVKNKKILQCSAISKIEKFERHEFFINTKGETSSRVISQDC